MANLASYLTGREIKPAVDEQYDPKPVGLVPIATIPAGKTLGKFKAGDKVTAIDLEQSLANSSAFTWMFEKTAPARHQSNRRRPPPDQPSQPARHHLEPLAIAPSISLRIGFAETNLLSALAHFAAPGA